MIWLVVLVIILMAAAEAPGLVKKKKWRELAAFCLIMVVGTVLSLGSVLRLPWAGFPTALTLALYGPLADWLQQALAVK